MPQALSTIAAFHAVIVLASIASARGETHLPAIFADHMVLQQERPIPVWGSDAPGRSVQVTLGKDTASASADAAGRWKATLPPQKAGDGPRELVVAGSTTVSVHDVLVGEVWFASGQSNMEFPLRQASIRTPRSRQPSIPSCGCSPWPSAARGSRPPT